MHGTGVVLTETTAGFEEELVIGMLAKRRRLQRVVKRLFGKMRQHRLDQLRVTAMLGTQLSGPGTGTRVTAGRQLQLTATLTDREPFRLQQGIAIGRGRIGEGTR